MEPLEQFICTIGQLEALAKEITAIETEKAAAASERRHQLLNECIAKEEAVLLKFRGLEKTRKQLARELGWQDYSFRKILEISDPEISQRLSLAFEGLSRQLSLLTDAKEQADRIILVRLHQLKLLAPQAGNHFFTTEWRI